MIIFEARASTILYNFLRSLRSDKKPFLIPSNVCPVVPLTFLKAQKPFEFVDISLVTLCIDEDIVLERIRKRPGFYDGVLYVRTYGVTDSREDFFQLIKEVSSELVIIDDKCLCIPSFEEAHDCSVDLTLFSTGYSKYVDLGFGGFAFLKNSYAYKRNIISFDQRCLDESTARCKYAVDNRIRLDYDDTAWLNTSSPPISFSEYEKLVIAGIGEAAKMKSSINPIYAASLPKEVQLTADYQRWRFNIFVPNKKELLSRIFASGLFASSHYASLDGILSDGNSRNAEKVHSKVINLFNDRYFSVDKAIEITKLINSHLEVTL